MFTYANVVNSGCMNGHNKGVLLDRLFATQPTGSY